MEPPSLPLLDAADAGGGLTHHANFIGSSEFCFLFPPASCNLLVVIAQSKENSFAKSIGKFIPFQEHLLGNRKLVATTKAIFFL